MMNADYREVGQSAMALLDRMQLIPKPHIQALGAAVVFQTLVEEFGIRPTDVMTAASNLRSKAFYDCPELRAVRDYVRQEIVKR